jgi:hypothetical protein
MNKMLFSIPKELEIKINEEVEKTDLSKGEVVRRALCDYFNIKYIQIKYGNQNLGKRGNKNV